MPTQMVRAAVLPRPNVSPEIRHYTMPVLEAGGVILRTVASEVCGTDVHLHRGKLAGVPYPLIPGHVSIGVAEAVGGDVFDAEGSLIMVGDMITFLDVIGSCGRCVPCTVWKATTRCPERKVYGITIGADEMPGLAGGWSEYIYLRPGTKIIRIAPNVSPDAWIGGGCGLPTAVHAIELAQIRLGDKALVQGSGPVGLSACILALLSGAGWVGLIGGPRIRLEAAEKFGIDWAMDIGTTTIEQRSKAVKSATGGFGPDIVIEASGNPAAVLEGCELVRDAGRYVIVGQYTDNGDISLNPHLHINKKHLEIRGCWGSDFSHVYRAMKIMERFGRQFDWSSLISKRYSLEQVGEALADVEAQRVVKAVILPNG